MLLAIATIAARPTTRVDRTVLHRRMSGRTANATRVPPTPSMSTSRTATGSHRRIQPPDVGVERRIPHVADIVHRTAHAEPEGHDPHAPTGDASERRERATSPARPKPVDRKMLGRQARTVPVARSPIEDRWRPE